MSYNCYIVEKLLKANKISALRTLLVIKNSFGGKFHSKQISHIANLCGTSKQVIEKHIKFFIDTDSLKCHLLEKSGEWHFLLGVKRFYFTHSKEINMDRTAVQFDYKFANYVKQSQSGLSKQEYESELQHHLLVSIRDLKKLRTYCYIALQEKVAFQYKKKQKTSRIVGTMVAESAKRLSRYTISSTYFSKVMNFCSATIRKHQNRATILFQEIFQKKRQVTVAACTPSFKTFISGKSLAEKYQIKAANLKEKTYYDYSKAIEGNSTDIVGIKEALGRVDNYSPYFYWKFKGNIVALLRETAPKIFFGFRCKKFHKKGFFKKEKNKVASFDYQQFQENQERNSFYELPSKSFLKPLRENSLSLMDLL